MRTVAAGMAVMLVLATASARAGGAHVVAAEAEPRPGGTWRFTVTVRHADSGWDHYADAWDVVAPDGRVLATRILAHPHVDEQPFTRSLDRVQVPEDVATVTIRARDSVHGYDGRSLEVRLVR